MGPKTEGLGLARPKFIVTAPGQPQDAEYVDDGFAPYSGRVTLPEPEEDALGIVRTLIETVIKG